MKYKWPDNKHETWYSPTEVMLYKTKGPTPELVVVDAASMSGVPLSDFQVIQEFPQGVISPETLAGMTRKVWVSDRYSYGASGVITKVSAQMPEDSARAVYVNFCDVPAALVSSTNGNYRLLDIGNIIKLPSSGEGGSMSVDRRIDHHRVSYITEDLNKRRTVADNAYSAGLAKLRETVVSQLVEGTLLEGIIGGYKINNPRCEIAYSDTVIQIPKAQFGSCLGHLNRNCKAGSVDVNAMLRGLAGAPCKGFPLRVNGTSVTLDVRASTSGAALMYINNHKIAHPDVDQVLNSVVCYPGAQDAYDDFVATSSKVSLKFHRAVANSIPWNLSGRYSTAPADDDDSSATAKDGGLPKLVDANGKKIRMPEFMRNANENAVTCMVAFRKSAGKRCEALLLGRWRKVRDFDIMSRFLTETSARGYMGHRWGRCVKLSVYSKTDSDGETYSEAEETDMLKGKDGKYKMTKPARLVREDESFVQLIARLDDCLVEEDWVIPRANYAPDTERGFRRLDPDNVVLRNTLDAAGLVRAAKAAVAEMFKVSTNTAVDKLIRSRALLEQVMAETGAKEFQKDRKWTFKVTGRSGNVYNVDEETAAVTDGAGQHICIVRASSKFENAGYDYIASLLCVLHDDRYTAKDVYTLKSRVGA